MNTLQSGFLIPLL